MVDRIKYLDDLKVISVESLANPSTYDLHESIEHILVLFRKHHITKIFIDASKLESLPGPFSIIDLGISTAIELDKLKIAIATNKNPSVDLEFLKSVKISNGLEIELCESKISALKWLLT